MYMLAHRRARWTTCPDVGGTLTQWHIHDNLCFTDARVARVAGVTAVGGNCPAG